MPGLAFVVTDAHGSKGGVRPALEVRPAETHLFYSAETHRRF